MLNGQGIPYVPPSLSHGAAPSLVPGQETAQPSVPQVPQPVPVPPPRRVTFGRVLVTVIGLMFLAGDLGTNTTYLVNQGQDIIAMFWLGIIAVAYQLGLVVTPTLLGIFWRERWFGYVLAGAVFIIVSFAAAIFAATGFVNSNFGDTQANRQVSINKRIAFQADLDRARAERLALVFDPATQAQIDAARDGLKNCDRRNESDECRARRRKQADLLDRQSKTDRAAELDNKIIPRLEDKVGALATIKSADPQIDGVVLASARLSLGFASVGPQTAESLRLLFFILLPLAAGLMFAWAEVLGERKRA